MTVISDVKTTLATLRGIEATFGKLALTATDQEAQKVFHESMMDLSPVIHDLALRVEWMKSEEPQYNNV